ncbi:MAG: hypothetical protein IPM39_14370 [Chloroflexi bacterium]|nr:hypothetical protein [Chloroflexota bacterium]
MQVTITIPATSANLGPGFDCLGLALTLYQTVTFSTRLEPGVVITASGEDAHKIPTDESNLVRQSAQLLFDRFGKRPFGLHIHQDNQIPIGSGLGSSSSAVLAGLLGGNALLGSPLSRAQILQQATDLEGHPDNVAPAMHGGLILGCVAMQDRLHQPYRIPLIPGLAAAFDAAYAAGAAGVALSGAGPSLIAFAPDGHEAIGAAITAVFAQHALASRTWILAVDTQGSRVCIAASA